jgi:hypothetical protein
MSALFVLARLLQRVAHLLERVGNSTLASGSVHPTVTTSSVYMTPSALLVRKSSARGV